MVHQYRRARWFLLDPEDPDLLTRISIIYNLGWVWRELEYPFKNENFAFQQFQDIKMILPEAMFRGYAQSNNNNTYLYSSP